MTHPADLAMAQRILNDTATDQDVINPDHYKTEINGQPVQAVDVIEAFFFEDAHLSQAFKYMSRAGKKPTSSYSEDIEKAKWWLERAIAYHDNQTG